MWHLHEGILACKLQTAAAQCAGRLTNARDYNALAIYMLMQTPNCTNKTSQQIGNTGFTIT